MAPGQRLSPECERDSTGADRAKFHAPLLSFEFSSVAFLRTSSRVTPSEIWRKRDPAQTRVRVPFGFDEEGREPYSARPGWTSRTSDRDRSQIPRYLGLQPPGLGTEARERNSTSAQNFWRLVYTPAYRVLSGLSLAPDRARGL